MPNHTLDVPVLFPDAKDCPACAERLRNRLGSVQGIAAVELDPPGRRLTLTYDPAILSLSALEAHVKEAGLAVTNRFRHATLRLEGLDCPECAGAVEHGVTHLPGVLRAAANFAAASLHVEYDAETTDLDRVADAVGRTGYRALIPGAASDVVVVRVAEMDCQDEVRAIEGRLRSLPGVAVLAGESAGADTPHPVRSGGRRIRDDSGGHPRARDDAGADQPSRPGGGLVARSAVALDRRLWRLPGGGIRRRLAAERAGARAGAVRGSARRRRLDGGPQGGAGDPRAPVGHERAHDRRRRRGGRHRPVG